MKKYIISETFLEEIISEDYGEEVPSIGALIKNYPTLIQEYKEPEQDMHYIGGQWYAKTGESQAVAQNINTPNCLKEIK